MKRLFLSRTLPFILSTTIFVATAFAGWTPSTGVAGCDGTYWFNDETQESVCCVPDMECPVGRRSVYQDTKSDEDIDLVSIFVIKLYMGFTL